MEYSEEEKAQNYFILGNTITEIEQGHNINKLWIITHKDYIAIYRDWIDDYSQVYPEIKDYEFRLKARTLETILNNLCDQIKNYNQFDISSYMQLNILLKYLVDYAQQMRDEDNDLAGLLNNLKVKN